MSVLPWHIILILLSPRLVVVVVLTIVVCAAAVIVVAAATAATAATAAATAAIVRYCFVFLLQPRQNRLVRALSHIRISMKVVSDISQENRVTHTPVAHSVWRSFPRSSANFCQHRVLVRQPPAATHRYRNNI